MNKIVLQVNVCVDDWRAELAIITSNDNFNFGIILQV